MGIAIRPWCRVHKLVLVAIIPIGAVFNLCAFLSIAGRPDAEDDHDDAEDDDDDDGELLRWADDTAGAEADETFYGDAGFSIECVQAALPSVIFQSLDSDRRACVVCVGEISPAEEVRHMPCCRHVFHTPCIDAWLRHRHRTCPLCRASLPSRKEEDEVEEGHAIVSLR